MRLIEGEGETFLSQEKSSAGKSWKDIIRNLALPNLSIPKRMGIAFATAAAVLIFIMLLPDSKNQNVINDKVVIKDKKTTSGKDTLKPKEEQQGPEQDKNIFAELTGPAFEPNLYLEEWITENVRSGREVIDTVLSPVLGEKFYDEEIVFKWNMIEKEPVSLKIIDNFEKEIFSSIPDVIQYPLLTLQLKPGIIKQSGLYYWRIENENEVLYVGKFYFLKKEKN
jgi:hypothetical protein